MIAALMVAAVVSSKTVDVTIDALVAAPDRFDGATVRLSGQIDSCWNLSCAICPKEAMPLTIDRSRCLPIEFERGQPLLSKPIRYSDVTVTARFDPSCMLRPGTCTDNGTVLENALVEAITRRRLSSEGLIFGGDPLQPASGAVENAVSQRVRLEHAAEVRGVLQVRIFSTSHDMAGGDRAVACWSAAESVWPTTWDQAILMRSSVDPWRCTVARKRDGQWTLQPWRAER
jgi:hypothetical protein